MITIDTTTPYGARVLDRLQHDLIGWFTTVDADGTPEPSPIWFFWDGATILIYSQPGKPKLDNISQNPRVAFSLDSDGRGGDIVIINGSAVIDTTAPAALDHPAYLAKYHAAILRIGMTDESFSASYRVPIRLTPETLRGH